MGRPRTPTAILKARGSRAALGRADLDLTPTMPTMPTWLNAGAAAYWRRIVPALYELGLTLEIDEWPLARLCAMLNARDRMERQIDAEGELIEHVRRTKWKPHPLVSALRRLDGEILTLSCAFGMTPASRARLTGRT